MKIYKSNEIKNIALLGSKGSGKTTLAEAMLFECGVIKRRGTIDAKNTVSDYFPVEKEYGYSVFSTIFYAEFLGKKLNVIDCPGADDFVGAAITALNVTDTGVIVINGQYGVEVGTQNIFRTDARGIRPQSGGDTISSCLRTRLQFHDRRSSDEEIFVGTRRRSSRH